MGTSISFGEYEAEKISEPWEESRYRDQYRAYYTQSLNMPIDTDKDGLLHCITVLTSLELNVCYTDSEHNVTINKAPRHCYLSALTIYMDNKGQIIKGEKILTEFMLAYDTIKERQMLDTSFRMRKEREVCINAKALHDHVIKNKALTFKTGKVYLLKKFHEYIIQASLCNRRTAVNYTHLRVTENRDEINKTLSLLGISLATIGFLPGKAPIITDTAMKILGLALSAEPRFNLAEYTYPIQGPAYLDKTTIFQEYIAKNYNGYVAAQKAIGDSKKIDSNILKQLEEWGLVLK
jgi:hypothetical protein